MNELIKTLEKDGIEAAVNALGGYDYKFYCLFLADIAESVLPVFEKEFPNDDRPRRSIQGIRDYHAGNITRGELNILRKSFYCADYKHRLSEIFAFIGISDYHAIGVYIGAVDAVETSEKNKKRMEIETLFIKHFGDKQ